MDKIRPTFLTVLCILTFIGSGFAIYSAITSYTTADVTAGMTKDALDNAMDEIENEAETEKGAEFANKIIGAVSGSLTAETIRNSSLASGISAILTLIGAILMWGLDKKGFWLYVIGTAVGVVAPIIIYGGFVGAISSSGVAFIGVIFCVLYGVNLKHMR